MKDDAGSTPEIVSFPSGPERVVMLPCDAAHFRDFMFGLLGRSQIIEQTISGPFDVRKSDIVNLHHLLAQRLSAQNEASFLSFQARIIYDDDSSVTLNSLEDMQVYNEVRPLISRGVHLSWLYLIKFQNKTSPEKQEIEISFVAPHSDRGRINRRELLFYSSFAGQIFLKISHTDRSWGSDISALLLGQLRTLIQPEPRTRLFVSECSNYVGWAVAVMIMALVFFAIYRVSTEFISAYLNAARALASDQFANAALKKLDFLIEIIASGLWTRYGFYVAGFLIMSLFAAGGVGVAVAERAGARRPSFVLFTAEAERFREQSLRRFEKNWITFCVSIAGALTLAVAGNYLFYKLSQFWSL